MKTKNLKEAQVRVGNVIFHIPFDGENYLLFKCRRCGRCCRGQLHNALMLTMGDIKRLSQTTKCGMSPSQFIEKMCVFATVSDGAIKLPFYQAYVDVEYTSVFLKRFPEETEKTVKQPHPCGHITDQNLCDIYKDRPITCQKFPYTTFHELGLTHVVYVDVPWSDCIGYFTRPEVNKKKLSSLARLLESADLEIRKSMEKKLIVITHLDTRR